jgi:hypothetical protein
LDPISDEFPWVSSYNYAENSPIANIDLYGLQAVPIIYGVAVGVDQLIALTTTYIVARKASNAIQDHLENSTNSGITVTNDRPKPLEGTHISKGNPTNKNSNNKNDFFNPLENLDAAAVMGVFVVGTIVTSLIYDDDDVGSNEVTDNEEVAAGEMDKVCGKHLKEIDPEYWYGNEMNDDQRDKYNENRNIQWQDYLLHNVKMKDENY